MASQEQIMTRIEDNLYAEFTGVTIVAPNEMVIEDEDGNSWSVVVEEV